MTNAIVPRGWLDRAGQQNPFSDPTPEGGDEKSLLSLALNVLAMLRRNLPLVLICMAITFGITVQGIFKQVPSYRASAFLRVTDRSPLSTGGMGRTPALLASSLNSQIQVLQSSSVAREVAEIEGARLQVDSFFAPTRWQDLVKLRGKRYPAAGWVDSVHVDSNATLRQVFLTFGDKGFIARGDGPARSLPFGSFFDEGGVRFRVTKHPGVARVALGVQALNDAATQIMSRLSARPREGTDILDVSYWDNDPVRARNIVNTAALVFQSLDARLGKQAMVRRRQFIEQQLHKTESLLSDAQAAQSSFRAREQVYNPQEQLHSQQAEMTTIEARRRDLASERKQLVALQQALQQPKREKLAVLMSSPVVTSNPAVAQVFGQYQQQQGTRDSMTTGAYARSLQDPDVRRLDASIAATETRLGSVISAQIVVTDAKLQGVNELASTTASKLATLPATTAQEAALQSQGESYQREADRLRAQVQLAETDEAAEAGHIEIVDLAGTPWGAQGNDQKQQVIFSLMLGLGIGMGIAYIRENHKAVIRLRSQLEQAIPVANLALIPQIRPARTTRHIPGGGAQAPASTIMIPRSGKDRTGGLVTVHDTHSTGAEAFRTLRTNLLFSASLKSVRSVIVTSASPQEGKSITTANLAVTFAQQGRRVLMLDCDLRRPSAHKLFGLEQNPGLTDVLIGAIALERAVVEAPIPGLFVLPAGAIPQNPAELLGGASMLALVTSLSTSYDMVLIDTPPLLAASDAAILSKITDGVLVVVRAGMTERAALQEGIHQLENVGARILGTVLNDPDAEVPKYATYYRHYYSSYYGYSDAKG